MTDANIRKVNYGCGKKPMEDWTNIDISHRVISSSQIHIIDLTKEHPFPDNWFNFGFSEDFIEHLSQADAILFLSEAYRTFHRGGVLRLSFPCLEGVLKQNFSIAKYTQYINGVYNAYLQYGHQHFFSLKELEIVCMHIGYRKFAINNYGVSRHEILCNLETRINQKHVNAYIEITK